MFIILGFQQNGHQYIFSPLQIKGLISQRKLLKFIDLCSQLSFFLQDNFRLKKKNIDLSRDFWKVIPLYALIFRATQMKYHLTNNAWQDIQRTQRFSLLELWFALCSLQLCRAISIFQRLHRLCCHHSLSFGLLKQGSRRFC